MKLNNLEIFERVYRSHWFLTSYNGIGFVYDYPKPKIGGGNFISQVIYLMENQVWKLIYDRKEFEKAANFTADKLINNNKWRKKNYQKIDYYTAYYFKAGDLLAMKKAGAIVTNTGGLISHAAITARELKIPCIVGAGNATLIFKDEDMVEVNADEGVIKKIN